MDIKDAEYQEWFNEPQVDYCSKEPLDNKTVLCEYWSLKNTPDVKSNRKRNCRLIIYLLRCLEKKGGKINLDYKDEFGLPEYAQAYEDNNKKPLIINLK